MTPRQPVLSLGALKRALSEERLAAYSTPSDTDVLDSVARYLWNGALATVMVPALHALEVTFRNNLFAASRRIVSEEGLKYKDVPCWLDADPSFLYDIEAESVEQAKLMLRRGEKPLTPGRLISKLGLGFWVGLCRSPYEQGRESGPALWPPMTHLAFPFLPKEHRSRAKILARLDEHRDLRNRVFHHEPIWDRNLHRAHSRILDTLSWMNQGVAKAVKELSNVESVVTRGPTGFRRHADMLISP
ncbi:MAG TPA: hypothetical protein VGA70_13600 [Longimicrobiales bacterium]|jgi:hypothetical protein